MKRLSIIALNYTVIITVPLWALPVLVWSLGRDAYEGLYSARQILKGKKVIWE